MLLCLKSNLGEVVSHYMWEIYWATKSERIFLFVMSTANACLLRLLVLNLYWLQLHTDGLVQILKPSLNSFVIMMTSSNGNIFRVTGHLWKGQKGQWRGALMFSLICVWINGWVNNGEAGDLRRYRAHYNVTVMNVDLVKLDNHACCLLGDLNVNMFYILYTVRQQIS